VGVQIPRGKGHFWGGTYLGTTRLVGSRHAQHIERYSQTAVEMRPLATDTVAVIIIIANSWSCDADRLLGKGVRTKDFTQACVSESYLRVRRRQEKDRRMGDETVDQ